LLAIYPRKNKGFVGTATIYRPKWPALGSFGLQRAGRGPRAMNSLSFEFRAHGGGSNGQIATLDPRRPGRVLRGLRGPVMSARRQERTSTKLADPAVATFRGRAQNRSQGPATTTMMLPGTCAA
jgi:hypothetical protein